MTMTIIVVYLVRVSIEYSVDRYYSIPEIADFLQLRQRDVRSLLRDQSLIAIRRGENSALMVHGAQIVDQGGYFEVLRSLRGTIIQLSDMGMGDDEIWTWLMSESPELGVSPLEALRSGNIHSVRRAAISALA